MVFPSLKTDMTTLGFTRLCSSTTSHLLSGLVTFVYVSFQSIILYNLFPVCVGVYVAGWVGLCVWVVVCVGVDVNVCPSMFQLSKKILRF